MCNAICYANPSLETSVNPISQGAGSRIRTDDLLITNQLLYQLSYAGISRQVCPSIYDSFRPGQILRQRAGEFSKAIAAGHVCDVLNWFLKIGKLTVLCTARLEEGPSIVTDCPAIR